MTAKSRILRRFRSGQGLAETMLAVAMISLIGLGSLALANQMLRNSHAGDATDNGLQISQNAVIDLETLASYNPNFLSSLTAGQTLSIPASQATVSGTATTVTATIVAVNTKPDSATHALADVTLSWPIANGKSQTAVIPVMPIATVEQNCNPSTGVTTDCINAGS